VAAMRHRLLAAVATSTSSCIRRCIAEPPSMPTEQGGAATSAQSPQQKIPHSISIISENLANCRPAQQSLITLRLAFGGYVGQCTSGTLYRIAYSSDVG